MFVCVSMGISLAVIVMSRRGGVKELASQMNVYEAQPMPIEPHL